MSNCVAAHLHNCSSTIVAPLHLFLATAVISLPPPGFNIPQEVPPHSWLRRGVAAPGNRYNLRPGRHWDGVDRSNGFEKQMFKTLNAQRARDLEARMWMQSDM
jgi:Pre-mRNA-splicing factor of RES complex